jgi:hypothetical protein
MKRRVYLSIVGLLLISMRCESSKRTIAMASASVSPVNQSLTKINSSYMITPSEARSWADRKSLLGPTYAGSVGWRKYASFLESTAVSFGLVDLDHIDTPYDHYLVDDWPDVRTHQSGSGIEVESLVSDGVPVPVVAGYGMTSGSTPPQGITAPMFYYDPANPPTKAQMKGKILVFKTASYTSAVKGSNGPYDYPRSFIDGYTMTDYEYRTPGDWYTPMFRPVPPAYASSFWYRWAWNQLGGFASIGIGGEAAGMVVVYDLAPQGALGLIQRSVYTSNGRPPVLGDIGKYINVPTLCLDRVNGAKVLTDAQAGKMATLKLMARFQQDKGRALIGYLPGRHYGTGEDQQIMLATHTDAMSLVEEDGGLGMLAILHYFSKIPRSDRPRTLVFYFDCRHFMPGGESAWDQYDYFMTQNPDGSWSPDKKKLAKVVAGVGMEHMGGRQTIESGSDGNTYAFSAAGANSGGLITSFIDLYNNNPWLIKQIQQVSEDNHWPRVDAKAGQVAPGANGGYQMSVKSAVNKGRTYGFPGVGLAGDWPGCCTQSFAGIETFDENYFLQQVAGLAQLTGELMLVDPIVIDLGWGNIRSGLQCTISQVCSIAPRTGLLPDSAFVAPASAPVQRQVLLNMFQDAHESVQAGQYATAHTKLQQLETAITEYVASPAKLNGVIEAMIAKLPSR